MSLLTDGYQRIPSAEDDDRGTFAESPDEPEWEEDFPEPLGLDKKPDKAEKNGARGFAILNGGQI
jgi:hypothetical protein